jgi:acetylornithine/succinyldiaminopimelate/putrescine aminotransferase
MYELLEGGVLENCRMMGHYLKQKLGSLKMRHPQKVVSVRGRGLIQGLELHRPGAPVVKECLAAGLIINCTAERILRFLPPLIINQEQIDECCGILDDVLCRQDPDAR